MFSASGPISTSIRSWCQCKKTPELMFPSCRPRYGNLLLNLLSRSAINAWKHTTATKLTVLGAFTRAVEFEELFQTMELVVVRSEKDFGLLRQDALSKSHTSINQVAHMPEFLPVIKSVKATVQIHNNEPGAFWKARPVPLAMQETVCKELDRLGKMGVISKLSAGANNVRL